MVEEGEVVANKAKGRISKRRSQESKARQIFRKTNISYPLTRTRTYETRPFVLLAAKYKNVTISTLAS